jgi:DNA-binding MarR family transcriptional regulator
MINQYNVRDIKPGVLSIWARLLLLYLLDRRRKNLHLTLSISELSEALSYSKSTVQRALKELTDCGLIRKKENKALHSGSLLANTYILLKIDTDPFSGKKIGYF